MTESLRYISVEVHGIAKTLNDLFLPDSSSEIATRASATNVIVTGVPFEGLNSATNIVELVAPLHPARFFIPVLDSSALAIRAEIAAACVKVSNGNNVCSEIVRIYFPEAQRASIPSIIKANMLPGLSSEVFVLGWDDSSQQLISQCDQVFIDSQGLTQGGLASHDLLHLFSVVLKPRVPTVDFNWVRLGVWREEMKRLFDLPMAQRVLSGLESISISSAASSLADYDPSCYTLAGWFAHRLGIEPVTYSRAGWECKGRNNRRCLISIVPTSRSSGEHGVIAVSLSGVLLGITVTVSARRCGSVIESVIEGDESVVLQRAIEQEDYVSVIERFFLVGDSTANFEPALTIGLEMYRLTRGFEG